MPQTEDEFRAAYRAGYEDRQHERDWDPMAHAPDDLIRNEGFQATIPLFVPGFHSGKHSDLVLGRVTINGGYAGIRLLDGGDFERYLTEGAYIGMTVLFPTGFDLQNYMKEKGIEWGSGGIPRE
ncbi:MAG TPA: hypothetical protein PKC73_00675 [Dermatophilaceae bacterium]|jgi:hypothetical protein|nr:hypothetical protein [Dermatophilaceae bacterium]